MSSHDENVIFETWEMVQREQEQGRMLTVDFLDVVEGYYAKNQADALMEPADFMQKKASLLRRIKFLFSGR